VAIAAVLLTHDATVFAAMYDLWDLESGNRVGNYRTERAALRDAANTVRRLRGALARGALARPGGTARQDRGRSAELVRRALSSRRAEAQRQIATDWLAFYSRSVRP
jgi:hypothetical protein